MTTYLLIGVTFLAVFGLIFLILSGRSPASARLMEVTAQSSAAAVSTQAAAGESWLSPDRVAKVLSPIRAVLGAPKEEEITRLASAGFRKPAHADIFYSMKLLTPALAVLATALLVKQNVFVWVVVAAAVGFLAPDLWLTQTVSKRRQRLRLSLPDALDLLVICMEAGLGLDSAIIRVGQELKISHADLSEEFLIVNLEQRAGKPRLEAWRAMAQRTGVESIRAFVHMLVQTERFGTPISKSLGTFADALRTKRRQQAEEMAAKTTIKLIPPLVLFIFPSLFIVLLGPAFLTIARSLAQAFSGP